MPDLRYSTFVDTLFTVLPEVQQGYAPLRDELGDSVLPYMAVGLVLEPLARQALSTTDDALLRRIFAFFEEMACSDDVEVQNLLYVEVFEAWVGERDTLSRGWKYMGKCTKDMATEAAHRLSCGSNLPRR